MLKARFCLVSDDSFTWLVEHATEVRARIRIDEETGTVAKGALWYEESLPAESVLAGVIQYANNGKASDKDAWGVIEKLTDGPMQFGGNATVGQGMARLHLHGGKR
jgi:CRISPR-associated protein Cmr4